ncbi:MAG: dephospho-CoA kinase [Hydrogenovibrio sp.]|nr:dephospho-CoA kinase [Hydrogenovibrio sp.]
MKTIAITGGIGSGKSTLRGWFQTQNIPTLDADQIARELVEPGAPGLAAILDCFGPDFVLADETLDRAKLRSRIFRDDKAKRQLEALLHPLIRQRTALELTKFAKRGETLAVVEIPLLTETGKPDYIDEVVLADCPPSIQIERTQNRSGLTFEEIADIMATQASRRQRLAIADHIIDTHRPLASVYEQLQLLLSTLQKG